MFSARDQFIGFYQQTKLFELSFFIRKKFPLDGATRQEKSFQPTGHC